MQLSKSMEYRIQEVVKRGLYGTLENMLKNGEDPDRKCDRGDTLLIHALLKSNSKKKIIKLLLQYGADIRERNSKVLFILVAKKSYPDRIFKDHIRRLNLLKMILDLSPHAKEAVNAKTRETNEGYLIEACFVHKYYEAAELIIEKGANVDVFDFQGDTPLMRSIKKERLDFIKLLVKKGGADVNRYPPDKPERHPLMVAYNNIKLIPRHFQDVTIIMKFLIKHGANPGTKGHVNGLILSLAISAKENNVVQLLISSGASLDAYVNPKTNEITPFLTRAIIDQNLEAFKLLLENGSDPNILDEYGRNCVFFLKPETPKIFSLILHAYGADFDMCNIVGGTVLKLHSRSGSNPHFNDFLLEKKLEHLQYLESNKKQRIH